MIQIIREIKRTPRGLQARITRAGGRNIYGQPNFRLVWGWSRLSLIGGKWEDLDKEGSLIREVVECRWEPKYHPFDRWHIERWIPPEVYGTPESWAEKTTEIYDGIPVLGLGPYPSEGEYEHCFTLQGKRGEFLNPDNSDIADYVVRAVIRSRQMVGEDRAKAKQAILEREAQKGKDWDTWADAVLDDGTPAFYGASHVVIPSLAPTTISQINSRRAQP